MPTEQKQIVYVETNTAYELPDIHYTDHIVIVHSFEYNEDRKCFAEFGKFQMWDWVKKFDDEVVTHWLKPVYLSTLVEEQVKEQWIDFNINQPEDLQCCIIALKTIVQNQIWEYDSFGECFRFTDEGDRRYVLYSDEDIHWQPLPEKT